ncbi:MAG TPA: amino acid adenylation domain-containing protein [Gammaproteobacteria bacterium]|nr:amino acid adenylation domain-containing protein [Gammaproteobacteria bacterium]
MAPELLTELVDCNAEADRQAVGYLDETLSYAQLARRSSQLANVLIDQGLKKGDRVGIYMNKGIDTAVAMYAAMKAGGAYVPIDPAAPTERLVSILKDCGLRHLVSSSDRRRQLRALVGHDTEVECVIGVDAGDDLPFRCWSWAEVAKAEATPPRGAVRADDLAYIIYTSGSTGRPKGIMHSHRSGLSFAKWAASEYGLERDDRLANHAPLHFDLSIFDYFAGAVAGATTVLVPEAYTKLPASYSQLLSDQRITVLFTVPFALIQLLTHGALDERDLSRLRWIIFGGEPFPTRQLKSLMRKLRGSRFDNMYGPAEINGVTHFSPATPEDIGDTVPIGPLSTLARSLVVDDDDRPLESGAAGELLVHTPTMMQGYWGRPDLDARAFYVHPDSGDVYYRTGDLVERRPDGVFEFLGRKDRQIKVRGYRIELDEVEAILAAHEGVEEAAAFSLPDGGGSQAVSAVVTLAKSIAKAPHSSEILAHAKAYLPWYALPSDLRIRESLPRTTTGKIDRRLLREQAMRGGE